jgi:hypothetical protein
MLNAERGTLNAEREDKIYKTPCACLRGAFCIWVLHGYWAKRHECW